MDKASLKIAAIIPAFSFLIGCANRTYTSYDNFEIAKIANIPNVSKDSIFEFSKMWIAQEFKSAKNVIEYENKQEGVVIGKGIIGYPCSRNTLWCDYRRADNISFTMRIDVKNEKAKFTFSNIKHIYIDSRMNRSELNSINIEDTADINSNLLGLSLRLQKTIDKKESNSNW